MSPKSFRGRNSGFTIMETATVVGVGSVIFSLVLSALVVTQKASNRFTEEQMLRQESLLVAQQIERTLRFSVGPADVSEGGAGQPTPAAGGSPAAKPADVSSTMPLSMSVAGVSSSAASSVSEALTTSTAQASPTVVFEQAPNSVQSMFTTATTQQDSDRARAAQEGSTTVSQATRRRVAPTEKFSADELVVCSLSSGPDAGRLVTAIRNSRVGAGGVHAYIEQSPIGNVFSPGARQKSLGSYAGTINCQVSFRYANEFRGTDAVWVRTSPDRVPQLIEYTIRVWPVRLAAANFEDAKDRDGRPLSFQLTSAVAIQ